MSSEQETGQGRTDIQAQQLKDEVCDNGLALARPDLSLGEGVNLPVRLHIHFLLLLLQLLQLLCIQTSTSDPESATSLCIGKCCWQPFAVNVDRHPLEEKKVLNVSWNHQTLQLQQLLCTSTSPQRQIQQQACVLVRILSKYLL